MERGAKRESGLDGLRGVAALWVFAIHAWIYQLPNSMSLTRDGFWETLLFEGRVAFVLFFVLSGYLLYRPFARAALGASGPASISGYFLRRAARIVPAYYLAIVGSLVLIGTAGSVPGRRAVEASEVPLFFLFGQNYSPDTLLRLNAATWTLVVEVAFYLMLPIVALLALRRFYGSMRAQALLLLSLVAVGLGWNLLDYAVGWGPVAGHAPPSFLPYFAGGMLVALAVEWRSARGVPPLGRRSSALLAAGAAMLLIANGYWHTADRTPDGLLMEVFADLGAAAAFGAIVAVLVLGTGTGLRWVGWRPFAWIGQISFGLYLWHIPLLVWARGHGLLGGGAALDVAVVLPVAVLLGAASWYLVELPLMRRAARRARDRSKAEREEGPQRSQARTIALANPSP